MTTSFAPDRRLLNELSADGSEQLGGAYLFLVERGSAHLLEHCQSPLAEGPGLESSLNLADCYLVLSVADDDKGHVRHVIYQWIGPRATLDKCIVQAVGAVLTNESFQEYGSEDEAFLHLFNGDAIQYEDDDDKASPPILVPPTSPAVIPRLYRFNSPREASDADVRLSVPDYPLQLVPAMRSSISQCHSYILDAGREVIVWHGRDTHSFSQQQCAAYAILLSRSLQDLSVTTINPFVQDDAAEMRFWDHLEVSPDNTLEDDSDGAPSFAALYSMANCYWFDPSMMSALQRDEEDLAGWFLDQATGADHGPKSRRSLSRQSLSTDNCLLLDCGVELYIWFGKRSSRALRDVLFEVFKQVFVQHRRPSWVAVFKMLQGHETASFKLRFDDWYRIEVPSLLPSRPQSRQTATINLDQLYASVTPRSTSHFLSLDDALGSDTIVGMLDAALVSCNAYVYRHGACRPIEPDGDSGSQQRRLRFNPDTNRSYVIVCVYENACARWTIVYFWQGLRASRLDHPVFMLTTWPELHAAISSTHDSPTLASSVRLLYVQQGAEPLALAAMWGRQICVEDTRSGLLLYGNEARWRAPRMFHMRVDAYRTCRVTEIECSPSRLISRDAFLLLSRPLPVLSASSLSSSASAVESPPEPDMADQPLMHQREVYVWYGRGVSKTLERPLFDKAVTDFLSTHERSGQVQLSVPKVVQEGAELAAFWSVFPSTASPHDLHNSWHPVSNLASEVEITVTSSSRTSLAANMSPANSMRSLSLRRPSGGGRPVYGKAVEHHYMATPILLCCTMRQGEFHVAAVRDSSLADYTANRKSLPRQEEHALRKSGSSNTLAGHAPSFILGANALHALDMNTQSPRLARMSRSPSTRSVVEEASTSAAFFSEAVLPEMSTAATTRATVRRRQSELFQQQHFADTLRRNETFVESAAATLRHPPYFLTQGHLLCGLPADEDHVLYPLPRPPPVFGPDADREAQFLLAVDTPPTSAVEPLVEEYRAISSGPTAPGPAMCYNGLRSCIVLDPGYPEPVFVWIGAEVSDELRKDVHRFLCDLVLWRQARHEADRSMSRTLYRDTSTALMSSRQSLAQLSEQQSDGPASPGRWSGSMLSLAASGTETPQDGVTGSVVDSMMKSDAFAALYRLPNLAPPYTSAPTETDTRVPLDSSLGGGHHRKHRGCRNRDPIADSVRFEHQGSESVQFQSFFHAWTPWDLLTS